MTEWRVPSFSGLSSVAVGIEKGHAADVLTEFTDCWDAGGEPDAAEWLARHPELQGDRRLVVDLAYEEFCRRRARGQAPDVTAFCARFPRHEKSLRQLLAVHVGIANNEQAAAAATPSRWPTVGEIFLGFALLDELGRGTFARVYLATEPAVGNRRVALKVSLLAAHEAELLGKLDHPNVVPVYSVSRDEATGLSAICMPYRGRLTLADLLDGPVDLSEAPDDGPASESSEQLPVAQQHQAAERLGHVAFDRRLPINRVVELAAELADALAYTHAQGICHGDLKPSNILFDSSGRPMLLDFNLSREWDAAERLLGGTLPYMAPEPLQESLPPVEPLCAAQLQAVDPRSDIYSLGIIVYELVCGAYPFGKAPVPCGPKLAREEAVELLARQKTGPRPVRALNPLVDRSLARLVESCLAFDPEQRPQSAEVLAAELRRGNSPVRRAIRWRRGHRGQSWGFAAALMVLGMCTITGLLSRPPYVQRQLALGRQEFAAAEYDEAIEHFGRAIQADPASWEALYWRGRARQQRGDWHAAIGDFLAAEKLTDDGRPRVGVAYCLSKTNVFDEAAFYYNKAIDAGFVTAELLNDLGHSHLNQSQYEDAWTCLTEALREDDSLQAAHYNRACLGMAVAIREETPVSQETVADILRALELGPKSGDLHCDAARVLSSASARDPRLAQDAIRELEKAIGLGVDPAPLRNDPFLSRLADLYDLDRLLQSPRREATGPVARRLVNPLDARAGS